VFFWHFPEGDQLIDFQEKNATGRVCSLKNTKGFSQRRTSLQIPSTFGISS